MNAVFDSQEIDRIHDILANHPDVKEFVILRSTEICDIGVAVIVPESFASAVEVREHLWRELGSQSAPDVVALVSQIPKDTDGKPDLDEVVRLVSSLDFDRLSRYSEPKTSHEKLLHEIFREILDLPRIGVNDGFVDLGGDSRTAMQVSAIIEERWGLTVSPEDVFLASDIHTLAKRLD